MKTSGPALRYCTFRLSFEATRRVVTDPLLRGDLLRGYFGITLRKLVCHDLGLDCRACLLRASCPYPPLFEPRAIVERVGWKDPPPPFVFRPDLDQPGLEAGSVWSVDLTLIGRAIERLPYVIVALRGTPALPGLASGALRLLDLPLFLRRAKTTAARDGAAFHQRPANRGLKLDVLRVVRRYPLHRPRLS